MKSLYTDVAIIGAGTAGMTAYRSALEHTENVVVIEDGPYGTTCARVGCMPSKLLIAAAEAAHTAQHAEAFGVHIQGLRVDGREVMDRVRRERDRFVGFVVAGVERWPAAHRLRGRARFVEDQVLEIDDHTRLHAQRIVVATGSRPAVPTAWQEALGNRLIINDDVFSWQTLPAAVAVVGTGVIGLEIAQALHRLGVRVRLYGRGSKVGPLTDPALQAVARQVFAAELPLTLDVRQVTPRLEGGQVHMHTLCTNGTEHTESFDYLLAATGRRPNIDNLGLERTTLPLDPAGMPVHDRRTGQIGSSAVFIAGDVGDEHPLLHEAADDGRIAGDNAGRHPEVKVRPRRAPLAVVFSDPQIMLAGQTHAQLLAAGMPFETGEVSFEDQGRSRVMLKNRGALRLYARPGSGRFLGAEMIGPAAEHLGHLLSWSVQRGDTVQQMLDSAFYHPVIEEGLRTALRDLQNKLRLASMAAEECLDCKPGS